MIQLKLIDHDYIVMSLKVSVLQAMPSYFVHRCFIAADAEVPSPVLKGLVGTTFNLLPSIPCRFICLRLQKNVYA